MKTEPVTPAVIVFGGAAPHAPLFDDAYHPAHGTQAQARHVFLQGNGLPDRWAGRAQFTVLETGFGLGNNFLATWQAWRDDPRRCDRLHYVGIERHPPRANDLALAHAAAPQPLASMAATLLQAWPPPTPNLHVSTFDGGRVRLLLALGDIASLLPVLRAAPDAFFLDGFTPPRCPAMWQPRVLKALGRMAAPGATMATWSVARSVRDGLATAGFVVERRDGIGGKWAVTAARHLPRSAPPPRPGAAPAGSKAFVVGAGIAGASAARALVDAGFGVTVVEQHAGPAQAASGNPAGIFHGTVHADDGTHARLFRGAALLAQRVYAQAIADGVPGSAAGLLRVGGSLPAMQALAQRQGLPPDYAQPLDAAAASAHAGVALPGAAWWYRGAGWVDPAALVRHQLRGSAWHGGVRVAALQRTADGWQVLDDDGGVIGEAAVVVLANAADAARLLAPLGHAPWPLTASRGQLTWFSAPGARLPRVPVAGDGYALTLPSGDVLCGASHGDGDGCELRAEDHRHNLERLQRLTGITPPSLPAACSGRTGLRLQTPDRLPIAGAMPLAQMAAGQRMDQARMLPREPGLFVLTGLGGRGLTLAPLLAELIAAQASGAPWPLEQDLADAVDPARWRVRAARRAAA